VYEVVISDADDGFHIARAPELRSLAINEQPLVDAVADTFEQRRIVQQDGELGRAPVLDPYLGGGHLSLDSQAGLLADEARRIRDVAAVEQLPLLVQHPFHLVLSIAGESPAPESSMMV